MALIAVASGVALAACGPSPDAPDAPPLPASQRAVEPDGRFLQRHAFRMELEMRVGPAMNLFRVELPEAVRAADGAMAFAPAFGKPGKAELLLGGLRAEAPTTRVESRWSVEGDTASMQLTVTNQGDRTAERVRGKVCLGLSHASSFRHEGGQGVWIFRGGRPFEFTALRRRDGYLASSVWVKPYYDARERPRGTPLGLHEGGLLSSRSGLLADDGVIVATSADGRWSLGTLWEDAAVVFHNFLSGHQCIHLDPSFGDLAPGASATRRGWLVVVEGPPEEARRKLQSLAARDAELEPGPP